MYKLMFGNVAVGDELIVAMGRWEATAKAGGSGQTLGPVVPVDDRPLGLALYPTFRVRYRAADFLAFERWVFDLAAWADGGARWIGVMDELNRLVVDYGYGKLLSLERPRPSDPHDARWSDQVVLTFQTDAAPVFAEQE
ncbi:MAG: hypothetical protein GXY33_13765 [Phycisphaerae bacterium]|nr:hypothetical protein [Phycisphaerae bacterium]